MRRLLLALPFALLASGSLVAMMAWMVDLNVRHLKLDGLTAPLHIYAVERETQSHRKNRQLPDPPQTKPKPPTPREPAPSKAPAFLAAVVPALMPMPALKVDVSVSAITIPAQVQSAPLAAQSLTTAQMALAPSDVNLGDSQQAVPIYRREPTYPRKALQRNMGGYVVLSFDISPKGRPENIAVVEAKPAQIFNREAMKALKYWQYQPLMVSGVAQTQTNQRVRLEFKIRE
jgi:protein TonB